MSVFNSENQNHHEFYQTTSKSDRLWHTWFVIDSPSLLFSSLGVGKTRLCQQICSANKSLRYINIIELARQEKFLLHYDDENQCEILDDDALNDYLDREYFQQSSGFLIDYHSAGIIPDGNQIHGIVVLRCTDEILKDRLKKGNSSSRKIEQTIQSEVFEMCLNEAREAFDETIVCQLNNTTEDDMQKNVEYLLKWIDRWPFNDPME